MPSKHDSSDCADYVPALCTHRPSLLPIERYDELFGQENRNFIFIFFGRTHNLNDGCLGSYSDEGRSYVRYTMKKAITVNHLNAECKLLSALL
ncbi:hypothetical protein Py17XNL_000504576 [Plasmodium yoelii yoelii]|uniref:Uncharacterized protein n=1 Tax=Plasmodium yoelii yoelii TaxID=73239 RepID=A0AAE9WSI7_PLAYO|nr:hypothetical protein Py17XNL_000504576 [Plasmodium yoelii yoelii]